jgi:hypothetical protein
MTFARRFAALSSILLALPLFAAFQRGGPLPNVGNVAGFAVFADFNHDGLDDVIRGSRLFQNSGSGFTFAGNLTLPEGVYAELAADFNGDGIMDLVGRSNSSAIPVTVMPNAPVTPGYQAVFLGRPNLAFEGVYPVGNDQRIIFAGDVDGDRNADFVIYRINRGENHRTLSTTLMLMRSRGEGTFEKAYETTLTGQNEPQSMTVADMNDDGRGDLVVRYPDELHVVLSRGNGYEAPITRYLPMQFGISSIIAGDIDLDGHGDVAIGGGDRTIRVLFGDGRGNFPRMSKAVMRSPAVAYVQPRNIAAVNYISTSRVDIAAPTSDGELLVYSWSAGELKEVSRTATGLPYPYVRSASLRTPARRDLYAFATFGNDDGVFYADGTPVAQAVIARSNVRARTARSAVAGPMSLAVSRTGDCVASESDAWRLERDGGFATDHRSDRAIDALIEDDAMYVRIRPANGDLTETVMTPVEPGQYVGFITILTNCGPSSVKYDARVQ